MAYKETNPDGLGVGSKEIGGTTFPKITKLERGGELVDIAEFQDKALESIGKAIAWHMVNDARMRRKRAEIDKQMETDIREGVE